MFNSHMCVEAGRAADPIQVTNQEESHLIKSEIERRARINQLDDDECETHPSPICRPIAELIEQIAPKTNTENQSTSRK